MSVSVGVTGTLLNNNRHAFRFHFAASALMPMLMRAAIYFADYTIHMPPRLRRRYYRCLRHVYLRVLLLIAFADIEFTPLCRFRRRCCHCHMLALLSSLMPFSPLRLMPPAFTLTLRSASCHAYMPCALFSLRYDTSCRSQA